MDKCPEWEFIKDTKVSQQLALQDGLFCDPVIFGKFWLNVRNTCAFNSLFQVIMNAIISNISQNNIIDKSENKTVQLAVNVLTDKQNNIPKNSDV